MNNTVQQMVKISLFLSFKNEVKNLGSVTRKPDLPALKGGHF